MFDLAAALFFRRVVAIAIADETICMTPLATLAIALGLTSGGAFGAGLVLVGTAIALVALVPPRAIDTDVSVSPGWDLDPSELPTVRLSTVAPPRVRVPSVALEGDAVLLGYVA